MLICRNGTAVYSRALYWLFTTLINIPNSQKWRLNVTTQEQHKKEQIATPAEKVPRFRVGISPVTPLLSISDVSKMDEDSRLTLQFNNLLVLLFCPVISLLFWQVIWGVIVEIFPAIHKC